MSSANECKLGDRLCHPVCIQLKTYFLFYFQKHGHVIRCWSSLEKLGQAKWQEVMTNGTFICETMHDDKNITLVASEIEVNLGVSAPEAGHYDSKPSQETHSFDLIRTQRIKIIRQAIISRTDAWTSRLRQCSAVYPIRTRDVNTPRSTTLRNYLPGVPSATQITKKKLVWPSPSGKNYDGSLFQVVLVVKQRLSR